MYLDHFGLHESPFLITPHTEFFYDGANRGAMLDALLYAVTHDEGIIKISGEVGSGKTMLCRMLMERLPKNVTIVYLANPSLSREDILYAIADELNLDLPDNARASLVLRGLQQHLVEAFGAGRRVVVLIDEAHAMPAETLEQVRLLSNLETNRHKLLQLVLFGQPELNEILARTDMRQLKERITQHFELTPLMREDIASYLDFRMRAAGYHGPAVFTSTAVTMIARASLGLTRRINILADKALLAAFTTGTHQIGRQEAQAAIRDCDFSDLPQGAFKPYNRPLLLLLACLAAGAVVIVFWLSRTRTEAPQPAGPAPSVATPDIDPRINVVPSTAAAPPANMPPDQRTTTPSMPTEAATPQTPASKSPSSTLSPRIQQYLTAGQQWLAQAPDHHWFIQLLVAEGDQVAEVERFLRNAAGYSLDTDQLRLYASSPNGEPRLGVIYGDYPTRSAAIAAINQLPLPLRRAKPYPRQVIRLK